MVFERVCSTHVQCIFHVESVHRLPFQNTQTTNCFCPIYVTDLLYTRNLSQFHAILQPKVVFQELKHVLEIPKFHIKFNQRTNGPVNTHLISWPSEAQNIQNLENIW